MAVKKKELYHSLWASCDQLRGGMDASQYKDYILTLLFMKYVTGRIFIPCVNAVMTEIIPTAPTADGFCPTRTPVTPGTTRTRIIRIVKTVVRAIGRAGFARTVINPRLYFTATARVIWAWNWKSTTPRKFWTSATRMLILCIVSMTAVWKTDLRLSRIRVRWIIT